jgi:hypothetical protein
LAILQKRSERRIVATSSNPMNRRRSERVMLRMKILVSAENVERKRQQEEAMTQVVNVHGGLMRMRMELHVGQPILLVNPQNKVEQRCRVVRIDDIADGDFAVAFEFDKPNPKFWPVVFPPEDWNSAGA